MPAFRDQLVAAVITAAVLTAGWSALSAPTATAAPRKPGCAQAVIDDWYGDGQIDGTYPRRCYREAIGSLRNDTKDYTHASEDILRALAYRKQGLPDPGDGASLATARAATTPSPGAHSPGLPSSDQTVPESVAVGPADELHGESAASLPVPLLVLGALSFVLLAAGGAGYARRRLEARRTDTREP